MAEPQQSSNINIFFEQSQKLALYLFFQQNMNLQTGTALLHQCSPTCPHVSVCASQVAA